MVLKARVDRSPGGVSPFLGENVPAACACSFHFAPFLECLITPMRPCLQGIARLQADNQSAQQSRKEAEGRAAAMLHENYTLAAQVSSLQTEKTQLQQEKGQLQEDVSHADECIKVSILCAANARCLHLLTHANYSF